MLCIILLAICVLLLSISNSNLKNKIEDLEEQHDMLLNTIFKIEIKKRDINEVDE